MMKKTLVLGASPNPDRYAYQAVHLLRQHGHEVVALGVRQGQIGDIAIVQGQPVIEDLHTVTFYLHPELQAGYLAYLQALKPRRLIFNPGTENWPLVQDLRRLGLVDMEVEAACTLILLRTGQY